jgi:integrase
MSVFPMTDKPHGKPRKLPWCCELSDATGKKRRNYFATKKEAKAFEAKEKERRRTSKTGMYSVQDLKKFTVREIIRSYMHSGDYLISEDNSVYDNEEELEETCELPNNQFLVLWSFSRLSMCERSLFDFDVDVAEQYKEDRLKKSYTPNGSDVEKQYAASTIKRDIATIQKAWAWAKKIPELKLLENPWNGIKVPESTGNKRQRGLRKGEREKLIKHCAECLESNRCYVPLAIYILVDTGMRRGELFNLTWGDIDFDNRTITIRESKTDWKTGNKGRLICLPPTSAILLTQLEASLLERGCTPDGSFKIPKRFHPPRGTVFMNTDKLPMTGEGFKQAFDQVRERAKIFDLDPKKRLTPHSLRAAAEMSFRRIGLTDKEIDIMKNGPKSHYDVVEDFLEMIHKKLDIAYYGQPFEELEKKNEQTHIEFQTLLKEGLEAGKTTEVAIAEATAEMLQRYPEYKGHNAWAVWVHRLTTVNFSQLASTQAQLAEEVT